MAEDVNKEDRPIVLGVSGGNILDTDAEMTTCCGGTLGALVHDSSSNNYVLSNNHVLARTNVAVSGEKIIQPGLIDQIDPESGFPPEGCFADNGDRVADLADPTASPFGFKVISLETETMPTENTVDAAIAQVVTENEVGACDTNGASNELCVISTGEIKDIGVPDNTPIAAAIDMVVTKRGRTTEVTTGRVAAIGVEIDVTYPSACGERSGPTAFFTQQIRIKGIRGQFSSGGDSGSLIMQTGTLKPVGLLFAGGGGSTFANDIQEVLDCLEVGMNTGGTVGDDTSCEHGDALAAVAGAFSSPLDENLPPGLQLAADVRAAHRSRLRATRGVVGTGLSLDENGEPVIEVYLESAVGDPDHPLPTQLRGVAVRTVVTGPIIAF